MMTCAGSPHADCNLAAVTPRRRRRFRARSRICFAPDSNTALTSPSTPASRLSSTPEIFPPTVKITISEPVAFASLPAASTARFPPGEPSVATTMTRGICLALLPRVFFIFGLANEGDIPSSRQEAYFCYPRYASIGGDTMSFGVLTLNFWNINEPLDTRYGALETGLKRLRPDIVCLQEVDRDPKSGRSQSEIIAKMCSHAHVVEDNGLAIVCSIPVVRSAHVSLPEFPEDLPRKILSAELLIDNRSLLVTNTHLAYPPKMI